VTTATPMSGFGAAPDLRQVEEGAGAFWGRAP